MLYEDNDGESQFGLMQSFMKNILKIIAENKNEETHLIASIIIGFFL